MIITHTQSQDGHRRIYLGAKLSLECWIEPKENGRAWTFHFDTGAGNSHMAPEYMRAWAESLLLQLCDELNVEPSLLADVPFEAIAALHTAPPTHHRRIASPLRKVTEYGFISTPPNTTRPSADYRARDFTDDRQRQRFR
ncbi:MAG: hypothetical protein K2Y42_06165 [Hyphomicrobium sp.]|jgi:hypothetical protein|uniref:hypothetical protein n=1 Tax=Hyphomicrobium sp. TaxID=82 RepID=UPI0025BF9FE2|nr:hypothetical protein [Hyphomicrobium sp.]MBX9862321.1 hypothetical protein [Hyphomicrobium sp.]